MGSTRPVAVFQNTLPNWVATESGRPRFISPSAKPEIVIEYRTFRNGDPPQLLDLWRSAKLGRGASRPDSVHAFDIANFSKPYFDPSALHVAVSNGRVVGFAHTGFGFNDVGSALDPQRGVICGLVVHDEVRRQGVGTQLLARACETLQAAGATSIDAGQSPTCDPFYFGLHGGARPAGFLVSDPHTGAFFQSQGFAPSERISILQRDLTTGRDPTHFRLIAIRRQTELQLCDRPDDPNWWYWVQLGNLETVFFKLLQKKTGKTIASVLVVGLDHYLSAWNERAIGLLNLTVEPEFQGQGYAQALLVEVVRRLRNELITRAEIHVAQADEDALKDVHGAGFEEVDTGIVYRRDLGQADNETAEESSDG